MAGLFSSGTLERVRAASDIVDVIGAYLPLKRAGANFVALCPFHREKTPSFNVNPQKQIFHCFGCHKGGDVFTFVREYENVDFVEAVRRLADRARIPLELEVGGAEREGRHIKASLLEIHEQITHRWQTALATDSGAAIAREYLARRGVTPEAVKAFRIGYAPDPWDDTVNWAKSKGYDLALVEQGGLILRKEGSQHYYDRFRGRLMFPICDEQGRVVGFSGRILAGDEKAAKYVNSPETPIFTKSKVIFGLDKSRRYLLEAGSAVVCEGQLDLIACFMNGVQNVVAPQGTAFTGEQARTLKRYVEEVVLCFDSDEAGQNAAVRSLDNLLSAGLAVRVAVVPSPHDPDSFIKAVGGAAFQKLIQEAFGFFDYYLVRLCGQNDVATDRGRLAVLAAMGEAVHKTGNRVLIDKYAQKTALRLGVSPESVRAEFRKLARAVAKPPAEAEPENTPASERPSPQEYWLLKILMRHDDLVAKAVGILDAAWIRHRSTREIIASRLVIEEEGAWAGTPAFLETIPAEAAGLVTEVIAEDRPLPDPERQLMDLIKRFRDQHLDREIEQLLVRATHPETSEAERVEMIRHREELRARKRTPLSAQGAIP